MITPEDMKVFWEQNGGSAHKENEKIRAKLVELGQEYLDLYDQYQALATKTGELRQLLHKAHDIILDSTPVLLSLEKSWLERKKKFMTGFHKEMGL